MYNNKSSCAYISSFINICNYTAMEIEGALPIGMAVVVVVTDDKAADRTPVEGEGMVIPVSTTMSNCQPKVTRSLSE